MAVNNEIGVVQPLREIGDMCRKHQVFFHTDAAQAVGKVPLDVNALNIDLMSISGHKVRVLALLGRALCCARLLPSPAQVYGPKGVGAIYVRRRPRVRLDPIINGGGQERGLRSGTVPTSLVVGLGAACAVAKQEMARDTAHVTQLSQRMLASLRAALPHIVLNGDPKARYPGNLNISFAYVEGESLLMGLKNIAVSSGSACTSASLEPSYVLRALGVEEDLAHTSLRFGIGRFTTEQEVDFAVSNTVKHVQKLRDMSPLWEMVQEGVDLKQVQWTQH